MPANLTPEFIKARKNLRNATTPEDKLACLEEMLATIPKHKGTDHMQADIKRRIAKLRSTATSASKSRGHGYDHIPKEGAGQVVLIGPPNAGKSSLLSSLTNAKPDVAAYPFSTIVPVPGMMLFEDVAIQLIDLPPVAPDYTEPWVFSLIRSSDLALVVLDASDGELLLDEWQELVQQLESHNIQLVQNRVEDPDERVRRIAARVLLTKFDLAERGDLKDVCEQLPLPTATVSAETKIGLDAVRSLVFEALEIVRVYTKLPGQKPDMTEPYTLPVGSQAVDAVRAIHREFTDRLKYVRIWGSGRFDGQQVPSDHVMEDGDIVEVHLYKHVPNS
jgi:uncharacterized protein